VTDTVHIENSSGVLNFTIQDSIISNLAQAGNPGGKDAIFFGTPAGVGNGTMNLTIDGSQVTAAYQFLVQANFSGTTTSNITITDSQFTNTNEQIGANTLGNLADNGVVNAGGGINLTGGGTGAGIYVNYHIANNTFQHNSGTNSGAENGGALLITGIASGVGTFDGRIINNTFGVDGVARSGSGNAADVLRLFASGNDGSHGHTRVLVQGNTIQNYGEAGIQINARQGNAGIDATIIGNTIRQPGTAAQGAFASIWVNSGALPADTNVVNIAIGGSNAADRNILTNSDPSNATDIFLDSETNGGAATSINLYRNGSLQSGGTIEETVRNILNSNNTGPLDLLTGFTNGSTIGFVNGLPPQPTSPIMVAPPAPTPLADEQLADDVDGAPSGTQTSGQGGEIKTPVTDDGDSGSVEDSTSASQPTPAADPSPVTETAPAPQAPPPAADDGVLSGGELESLVEAAIQRWADAGASAEQVAAMRAVKVTVSDMSGIYIGSSNAGEIRVDTDGAGYGWFVDATPGEDSEFEGGGSKLSADTGGAAEGKIDLLTVLMHELGHQVGLDDSYAAGDAGELMYGYLTPGERRLPADGDAAGATAGEVGHTSFMLAPITLPAGTAVEVQYQVRIASFTNQLLPGISNTTTVTGTNFNTAVTAANLVTLDSLTLGNRVWLDSNGNGVQDDGENGLQSVKLSLFVDTNGDNLLDAGDQAVTFTDANNNLTYEPGTDTPGGAGAINLTAITDANGAYSFINLAPGDYIVRVDAVNFDTGGALAGMMTSPGDADPDTSANNTDDNGVAATGIVFSRAVTLAYNSEPTADSTGKLDINNTVDFGFMTNVPPTLAVTGANATYTETAGAGSAAGTGVVVLSASTLSDADDTNMEGATISIAAGFVAGDMLGFEAGYTLPTGISSSYVSATGILTLSGTATLASYKAALENVRFSNAGDNPTSFGSNTSRTISFVVNDGAAPSPAATATVTVAGINDMPVNTAGGAVAFQEDSAGSSAATPPANAVTGISVFDADADPASADISVTLAVTGGTLAIRTDVGGGLAAAEVSGNGTSTLTLTGTQNQINATLAAVNASNEPNGLVFTPAANFNGSASLTITTNDGSAQDVDTKTINVTSINDAPVVAGDGTESVPSILEDTPSAAGTQISLLLGGQYSDAADNQAANGGSSPGSFTGIAIVANGSGAATGQWQWLNTSNVWVDIGTASPGAAVLLSSTAFVRFNPALDFNGAAPTLTANLLDNGGSAITNGSTVDLSGAGATGGSTRYSSGTVVIGQSVTPVNDAPVVNGLDGDLVLYTENAALIRVDAGGDAEVRDVDSANFDGGSLTLSIVTNKVAAEDVLLIDQTAGVTITGTTVSVGATAIGTVTSDGLSGRDLVISFNADATPALVQTLIHALAYTNSNVDNPNTLQRGIRSTLIDGDGNANFGADTRVLNSATDINAVNDDPTLALNGSSGPSATLAYAENDAASVIAPNTLLTDVDSMNFDSGTLTVSLQANGEATDQLGIRNQGTTAGLIGVSGADITYGGVVFGTFTGGTNGGNLIISFDPDASHAAVQSLIRNITYHSTSDTPSTSSRTINFLVTDGDGGSGQANAAVNVTSVNDAPAVSTPTSANIEWTEDTPSVALMQGVSLSDIDNPANFAGGSLTITVGGGEGGINFKAGSLFSVSAGRLIYNDAGTPRDLGAISLIGTTNVAVTGLTAEATLARLNDLADDFTFFIFGDNPTPGDRTVTLTFNDGGNSGSDAAKQASVTQTLKVVAVNDTPAMDLNGAGGGTSSTLAYTENAAATSIAPAATVSDTDSANFGGGSLTISFSAAGAAEDRLSILNVGNGAGEIGVSGSDVSYGGTLIGTLAGGTDGSTPLVVTLNADATPAAAQALVRAIAYSNVSDNPVTTARQISFSLNDGDGGAATAVAAATVNITSVNDAAVVASGGSSNSFTEGEPAKPVDPSITVSDVDDATLVSGTVAITGNFRSGEDALAFNNNDNALFGNIAASYDNMTGVLSLTSAGGTATLAQWQAALRAVTYFNNSDDPNELDRTISFTVNDGDIASNVATKQVKVFSFEEVPPAGTDGDDIFDLRKTGDVDVSGLGGNDGFIFGGSFTAADRVDGGPGNDQVSIRAFYDLTFGPRSLVNIETLLVLPGFDYNLTSVDANVAAGQRLQIFGTTLGVGDNLTFNGSAETDGYFVIYGGGGIDTLTGGSQNDGFYFGPGNFSQTDTVHGGAGNNDQLGLDGHYSMTLGGNFDGIETLVLYRGPGNDLNKFNLVTNDAAVAAGQRFTIFGSTLGTDLVFNGSAETDGSFRFLAGVGNDTLTGGKGDDIFFGGRGGDTMNGGGGNDVFIYNSTAESTAASFDKILSFGSGDRIDLSGIDANSGTAENDSFAFIGADAFTGAAGQLRLFQANGGWTIEGDTNGDKLADLMINVSTDAGHIVVPGDFMF
jgi:hypothetical protein